MLFKEAISEKDFQLAGILFQEYAAQLSVDLSFQNFQKELATLKSQYTRPTGILILAYNQDKIPLGCFGIRALDSSVCELKRMYLKQQARGLGLGKKLLRKALLLGKELGYQKMRLDTLPTMNAAINLYKSVGFYEIDPYRFNPVIGSKYLEMIL